MALRLRHGLSLVILVLWVASTLLAQSRNPGDLGVGKLLVAFLHEITPSAHSFAS